MEGFNKKHLFDNTQKTVCFDSLNIQKERLAFRQYDFIPK